MICLTPYELGIIIGLAIAVPFFAGYELSRLQVNSVIDEVIQEKLKKSKEGEWVWADLYSESVTEHPENPNINCFTKVWLPKDSL